MSASTSTGHSRSSRSSSHGSFLSAMIILWSRRTSDGRSSASLITSAWSTVRFEVTLFSSRTYCSPISSCRATAPL